MELTKKYVIIRTTNRVNGMLEQGGVEGRVVGYPIEEAINLLGVTVDQLRAAEENELMPNRGWTWREGVEWAASSPRVFRRGNKIQ